MILPSALKIAKKKQKVNKKKIINLKNKKNHYIEANKVKKKLAVVIFICYLNIKKVN